MKVLYASEPSVIVCVDTNALYDSPFAETAGWSVVLAMSRQGRIDLVVPQVVVLECDRQYRERLNSLVANIARDLGGLRKLRVPSAPLDLDDAVAEAAASYMDRLTKVLIKAGGTILPIPSVPHESLIQRDLNRRPPFKKKTDEGYRDTLIWESLVEHLRSAPLFSTVVLVSNDNIFADDADEALSPLLTQEVEDLGREQSIVLVKKLPDVPEQLKWLQGLAHSADSEFIDHDVDYNDLDETVEELARAAVLSAVQELAGESVAEPHVDDRPGPGLYLEGVLPPALSDCTVLEADPDATSFEYHVIDEYEGDTSLLHASIDASVLFEGFIHKADYAIEDDEAVEVYDSDWNDHVMHVGYGAEVRLWFNVTVIGQAVEDIQFDFGELMGS